MYQIGQTVWAFHVNMNCHSFTAWSFTVKKICPGGLLDERGIPHPYGKCAMSREEAVRVAKVMVKDQIERLEVFINEIK